MTQDEIIEMARQSDIDHHKLWNDDGTNRLEAFAKLVAEREREVCAHVAEDWTIDEAFVTNIADAIRARGEA
jgi:hypothetical protein